MPSLYRALHLCLSIMNPLTGDWQGFNTVKQACFLSPDFQRWWKSAGDITFLGSICVTDESLLQ